MAGRLDGKVAVITGGASGIACDVADEDSVEAAIPFLLSGEASYVNGQAIAVDGGLSSSHPFNHQSYGRTTT